MHELRLNLFEQWFLFPWCCRHTFMWSSSILIIPIVSMHTCREILWIKRLSLLSFRCVYSDLIQFVHRYADFVQKKVGFMQFCPETQSPWSPVSISLKMSKEIPLSSRGEVTLCFWNTGKKKRRKPLCSTAGKERGWCCKLHC